MSEIIQDEEDKKVNNGWFSAGILTIVLAFLMPFIIMLISSTSFNVKMIGELGAVGDFFGGSTIGLLSIASIFFIIHTISIQSKELSLQRKELQYTRDELKQTREVHEESNKTQTNQRFETTFFNMLSLQKETLNNLNYSEGSKEYIGRNVTSFFYDKFVKSFNSPSSIILDKILSEKNIKKQSNIIFTHIMKYYGDYIGPYFKNLQIIISFLDRGQLTMEEKNNYLEILKAQMSKTEMRLVFYYVSSTHGEDLTDLILRYDFFKGHLKPGDLIHSKHYEFLRE